MSEASCTCTSPYDLVVRHTSDRLSLNIVSLSFMQNNILSPEYHVFMCDCVFLDGCLSQF